MVDKAGSYDKKVKERSALGRRLGDVRIPAAPSRSILPVDYAEVFNGIKQRIKQERLKMVMAANSAMVLLYWDIGRIILEQQDKAGWGAKIIDRLASDLREAFPDMKGFSPRNLKYMRAFAAAWTDRAIVQQLAAQIPWFHNCVLLDRVRDPLEREWYIRQIIEHGWSRNVLSFQISGHAFQRAGKAITNFPATLPPADSDMASAGLKEPEFDTDGYFRAIFFRRPEVAKIAPPKTPQVTPQEWIGKASMSRQRRALEGGFL